MVSEIWTLEGGEGDEGLAVDLLVERARRGEEAAFEEILSRFEGKALAIARQLGASRADAEDVAQEAFLRVFRGLDTYRGGRRFAGWFCRIVVNVARDHLARRARDPGSPGAGAEGAEAGAPGTPDHGEGLERRDRIDAALRQLSPREREVVLLRDVHGLSTWETARALGLNPITVRRHLMRARARLKDLLG